jgi:hypothetical protein
VRNFLNDADAKGWMFAGAYFFNLVNLVPLLISLRSRRDKLNYYNFAAL